MMIRMLRADLIRMKKSRAFLFAIIGMIAVAAVLMVMQATAMDYTVPLSRVIFLPLSMYGVAMAAFVSVFNGTDFSDGCVRNKLIVAEKRSSLVISHMIVSCMACFIVYAVVTVFTAGIGYFFFENDIKTGTFIGYIFLGIAMSVTFGCLFSVITVICGDKTRAIVWCMGIAFVMLFVCMRTNAMLVQPQYKDGILNPKYIDGFRRVVYSIAHDLNPYGQASQLSSWEVWNPFRAVCFDVLSIAVMPVIGCFIFNRKDIK